MMRQLKTDYNRGCLFDRDLTTVRVNEPSVKPRHRPPDPLGAIYTLKCTFRAQVGPILHYPEDYCPGTALPSSSEYVTCVENVA